MERTQCRQSEDWESSDPGDMAADIVDDCTVVGVGIGGRDWKVMCDDVVEFKKFSLIRFLCL